jgi:hypothetical protein
VIARFVKRIKNMAHIFLGNAPARVADDNLHVGPTARL